MKIGHGTKEIMKKEKMNGWKWIYQSNNEKNEKKNKLRKDRIAWIMKRCKQEMWRWEREREREREREWGRITW